MHRPDLDDAKNTVHKVQDSSSYHALVRGGLVAFGVVHLLIGYLAVRLALGSTGEDASQTGALRELSRAPMGPVLLWAVTVGLFTIALWQLLSAFVGHRHLPAGLRDRRRAVSVGRTFLYGVLAVNAAIIASGGRGGDGGESVSATLLSLPFGRALFVVLGIAVGSVGVSQVMRGARDKYNEELRRALPFPLQWVARVGHVGKGAAIMVVGALFIWAAWTYDSDSAGGLDNALQTVRSGPFGDIALLAIALGFGCYGIYSFLWARHARFH